MTSPTRNRSNRILKVYQTVHEKNNPECIEGKAARTIGLDPKLAQQKLKRI
jgi:hypothetical protein